MNIGLGSKRKTILLIDSNPHERSILRIALEAVGFTVGESVNGYEGERTTARIKPDAILADSMMETIDAGGTIMDKLRRAGTSAPLYIVSTLGDALVGSVSLQELGIAGVFIKPIDPAIVIQTLKTRLNM
jgi:DNA-binding response OmpR family regulator